MLFAPAIMALVLVSAIVSLMLLLASGFAFQLVRHWDISSGSERQLRLERRTYLISALLVWAFASELASLLLFIYNAEAMSGQFVGAMCATGVLNVNGWGWPTLFMKIVIFFSAATWLVLNQLDNQGHDYPLIRIKYRLLLLITPLVLVEFLFQLNFFLQMDPDVITSCCGSLFSADAQGVAGEVAGLAPSTALWLLLISAALLFASGIPFALCGRGGAVYAFSASFAFVSALIAIISFIALYIYEHPHHHCPFCILKEGHDYLGYLLYIPLFCATALALGGGVTAPWHSIASLKEATARLTPVLAWSSLSLFLIFYLISAWVVFSSNLVMDGVWW
jgi:hypothetical protein